MINTGIMLLSFGPIISGSVRELASPPRNCAKSTVVKKTKSTCGSRTVSVVLLFCYVSCLNRRDPFGLAAFYSSSCFITFNVDDRSISKLKEYIRACGKIKITAINILPNKVSLNVIDIAILSNKRLKFVLTCFFC